MKKILIFSHALEIGGAERALLGLLESIDTTKYQVDLFLMRHEGEMMQYIPEKIHLLPEISEYTCLAIPFKEMLKKRKIGMVLGRAWGKYAAKRRIKKLNITIDNDIPLEFSHKYTLPFVPCVNEIEYDLAISFLTPHYFVSEKVKAKQKIAWIHTDYSYVMVDYESQVKMWDAYDHIVSISEKVTESFVNTFPLLESKIILIPNMMPMNYMQQLSKDFLVDDEMCNDGSIKLLSVGRFCEAKNFDNIPAICKKIRELGINVKWYIIGFGNWENIIKEKVRENKMEEYVIILGKKENPYPYFKACDYYIQPSRYEGKCVSVIEAQMFHKPVIITNYATSGSQLERNIDGIIVPIDNDSCADGIAKIITNKELTNRLITNTKKKDYSNHLFIDELYQIIESVS